MLASVMTGLLVASAQWSPQQWRQMSTCGVPVSFECLLSSLGVETGMLEDWVWAVDRLSDYSTTLSPLPVSCDDDDNLAASITSQSRYPSLAVLSSEATGPAFKSVPSRRGSSPRVRMVGPQEFQ
ncbi:unnamed protein product, partial [Protopolystoma xenopodis]